MSTQNSSSQEKKLTSNELIRSGLNDQIKAIAGYEGIIWKIRTGYVVVLYGALTLVLGKEIPPGSQSIVNNLNQSLTVLPLVIGLSLSVFLIDFGYVRKKLKFVVAREMLIELACEDHINLEDKSDREKLKRLLHIAGETLPKKLPERGHAHYKEKLYWNLFAIMLPIYLTTPLLAVIIFAILYFR